MARRHRRRVAPLIDLDHQPPAPINRNPADIRMKIPVDILASYFYFQSVDLGVMHSWGTRIIGDSGAFSALTLDQHIDRESFHAWVKRWEDDLLWAACLDVIGDAKATRVNWKAAQADGLNLIPTVHYLGSTEELDWYVEQGADLVGLGGLVPYSSEQSRLMRWLLTMFRHARDHHPHVRFHGWGVSNVMLLDKLPWWSADSSGFSSAFRYGRLNLFDPGSGSFVRTRLDGSSPARHRELLQDHYRVDWKKVAVSDPNTRRDLGRTAMLAVQLHGEYLARRQKVSPPASLIPKLDTEHARLAMSAGIWTAPQIRVIHPDGDGYAPRLPEGERPGTQDLPYGTNNGPQFSISPGRPNAMSAGLNPDPSKGSALPLATRQDPDTASQDPDLQDDLGPHVAASMGIPRQKVNCLDPEDGAPPMIDGPITVSALGAPSMQPTKAIDPEDGRPSPLTPSSIKESRS